jgi:aromatic-L-amino-acid decarboxylase
MAAAATEFLVRFIEALPSSKASDLEGAVEAARSLREPAPEVGGAFEPLLEVVEAAAAKGFNTTGPGYLAYIPGGGLWAAVLGEYLAYGVNRYVNVWNAAPVFAEMEATVLRWIAAEFRYPAEARGILTTGGSMANFSAIVAARRALLGDRLEGGTLYVSEQTHASVAKSAILAGFPSSVVRAVPCGDEWRIDVGAMRSMIEGDRTAGLRPFCIVGNAGTTNTGAVDALGELADLAAAQDVWLHIDGAYGGFFQLTERGREAFEGISRADSITLDPHKGMFLPYGTGCLLVRDGAKLREAHQVGAEYLQDLAAEDEIPNFADYSPELSRDNRGLRVWLPLRLHGFGAFRAALDEKLDLAAFLADGLTATEGFVVVPPQLTVVAFRYEPQTGDPEAFNRSLLERINASKRVFLSSTMLEGRFTIRACIISHRTHRDRVEEALDIIRRAAAELQGGALR